jgi:hypothetical protein
MGGRTSPKSRVRLKDKNIIRLTSDAVKLICFENQLLFDALHGVVGAEQLVLDKVDFSERTAANYFNDLEVVLANDRCI